MREMYVVLLRNWNERNLMNSLTHIYIYYIRRCNEFVIRRNNVLQRVNHLHILLYSVLLFVPNCF